MGQNLQAQPTAQNQLSGIGLVYDAAGDVLTDNLGDTYTYDPEGRVATATTMNGTWTYGYDGDGNRVLRSGGGSAGTVYWYGEDGSLTDETTVAVNPVTGYGDNEGYFYLNGHLVFRAGIPTAVYPSLYVLYNQIGSSRVTVDSSGNTTDVNYFPFGAYVSQSTGTLEQAFTGKERDAESGNDYFGVRYYASSMGRFLSPDWSAKVAPVPYANLDNPQSLNLYS